MITSFLDIEGVIVILVNVMPKGETIISEADIKTGLLGVRSHKNSAELHT